LDVRGRRTGESAQIRGFEGGNEHPLIPRKTANMNLLPKNKRQVSYGLSSLAEGRMEVLPIAKAGQGMKSKGKRQPQDVPAGKKKKKKIHRKKDFEPRGSVFPGR